MKPRGQARGPRTWLPSLAERPVLGFSARFASCVVLLYVLSLVPSVERAIFAIYLPANAFASGIVLKALGQPVRVDGSTLRFTSAEVNLRRGCDSLESTALLAGAMVSFPTSWRRRLKGVILGGALLAVLNLVRIVTLCLARMHWPAHFDALHLELWPGAMILAALGFWLLWAASSLGTNTGNELANSSPQTTA